MLTATVIISILVVVVLVLLIMVLNLKKKISQVVTKLEQTELALQTELSQLKHTQEEQHTTTQQLPKVIELQNQHASDLKNLATICANFQQALEKQANDIQLLQTETGEDKLYIRAKKLIALGADVEEVISECGISRSEADLLMSIIAK